MGCDLAQYLGIPFRDHGRDRDGCDCWGLVRLVYQEQLGVTMPDLGDAYSDAYARGEVDRLVARSARQDWTVDVTNLPRRELDVLVFLRAGVEAHVGLYAAPGVMLHVTDGMCAAFERYDTAKWSRRFSRALRPVAALCNA